MVLCTIVCTGRDPIADRYFMGKKTEYTASSYENLRKEIKGKEHVLTPEVSNNFISLCFYFLNYYNSS